MTKAFLGLWCVLFLSSFAVAQVAIGGSVNQFDGGGGGGGGFYCTDFNTIFDTSHYHAVTSHVEHYTWGHSWSATGNNFCTYTAGNKLPSGRYQCLNQASTYWEGGLTDETGLIWQYLLSQDEHLPAHAETGVNFGSVGIMSASAGMAAFDTVYCNGIDYPCSATTITFDSHMNPIYTRHLSLTGHVLGTPFTAPEGITCPNETSQYGSPIVIDLNGGNFEDAFTDIQHGVVWDFYGRGKPVHISWTNPDRNIGFLVLDRPNKGRGTVGVKHPEPPNGIIDSAREMFGNLTYQPLDDAEEATIKQQAKAAAEGGPEVPDFETHGFRALAFFDRPENGGNGDGKIDASDKVWPDLRVCVDKTQTAHFVVKDCQALDELGITSISLKYVRSSRVDQWGNEMRFEGSLTTNKIGATVPRIYDVFFQSTE